MLYRHRAAATLLALLAAAAPGAGPLAAQETFDPDAEAAPSAAAAAPVERVTLYFDPALSTPTGLQDSALALARRARELTLLGPVEVVLADPEPAPLLPATRDPDALASTLGLIADEGGSAGALAEIRYELLDLLAAGGEAGPGVGAGEGDDLRRLYADETALLARAWGRLAGWLALRGAPGGALLILSSDGFDADPAAFYRARAGGVPAVAGAEVPDWSGVGRAASAGRWIAVPLALGDPAGAFAQPHAPLAALAAATGGELVTSDAGLAGALARVRSGMAAAAVEGAAGAAGGPGGGDTTAPPIPPGAAAPPVPSGSAPSPAPAPPPPSDRPAASTAAGGRVIVLLPPRRPGLGRLGGSIEGAVTGRVRFETLVTRDDVARVVFSLDGAEVATDDGPPFSATVELGEEARPRTVRAVALSTTGRELGASEIELNRAVEAPFGIRIAAVEGEPESGAVEVEAAVSVPSGQRLERVEWYFNDTLAASRTEPPFRARVATPTAAPTDFLRVVALLADGAAADDAVLLAARGEIERVEVNLVEVFAVVSDRDGEPVEGLSAGDFTVRVGGRELPVESFRIADQVPLLLGLLIDTSESMWPLMVDTQRAAARFLGNTLHEGDAAFLVSFDDRPRLIHPPTADLVELLTAFGGLRASGRTALYDAIVFALTQMEGDAGRRALVLLTDGQDWGSQFGPDRAVELGRSLGVPVYILVFGDLYGERRARTQPDLDAVTARTGGRLFYIDQLEQLDRVYASISEELRSQYVLAVSTERPLSAEELGRVEVEVEGRGRRVRAAVGGGGLR